MKRIILILGLAISCLTGKAQNYSSLSISGDFVYMPSLELKGAGYSLAYQQRIIQWLYFEGGASYAIASKSIGRDKIVNNIQLLDLNYHHASYNFYVAPVSKINIGAKFVFDLYLGPMLTYQSNVFDLSHYKILDETESVYSFIDYYSNKSQEGAFFGGIAGIRGSLLLGSNWSIVAGSRYLGIIHGESSLNAGLGLRYNW